MTEIVLKKFMGDYLCGMDDQSVEQIRKHKDGQGFSCIIKKHNNPLFHRKMFALFQLGFENWEPKEVTYKGEIAIKNFDRFRQDITILAGFYETTVNLNGDVRLIAKSLSFSSMGQDERETLYNGVLNVLLSKVLKNYKREDVEEYIEKLIGFT